MTLADPVRRALLACVAGAAASFTRGPAEAQTSAGTASVRRGAAPTEGGGYTSPYSLRFSFAAALLNAGFDQSPWDDPEAEADEPFKAWEDAHAGKRDAAWGPPARQYPAPALPRTDAAYLRERVLGIAARHIGLAYQHHHLPSWVPPAGWPWLPVKAGANGPGLDCSNFTSFVFNYALGIKLPTGVADQGWRVALRGAGGAGCLLAAHVPIRSFATLGQDLRPADLLYIRNRRGAIGHVVIWLGPLGRSPDGGHLVIDCSDMARRDAAGQAIPTGVQLRPFRETGWYWRNLVHAHRLIGGPAFACAPPSAPFPEGGDTG